MPLYRFGKNIQTNDSSGQTKKRFYTKIVIWTTIAFIPFIVYIYLSIQPPVPVSGKTINKGYYDPFNTFTTDWFTFRTDKQWEEATEITKKDQMYVYRQKSGGNAQGLLTIYVNNTPVPGAVDYFSTVLPVKSNEDRSLTILPLEPKCDALLPKNQTLFPQMVQTADTTFKCWPDAVVFYAVAGQVGGTSNLQLKRENGDLSTYIITYRNIGFYPSESSFAQVLATFKSK